MLPPFIPWVDSSETPFAGLLEGPKEVKHQLTIVVANSIIHPIVFPFFLTLPSRPTLLLPKNHNPK